MIKSKISILVTVFENLEFGKKNYKYLDFHQNL